jgi:hypothetical protein
VRASIKINTNVMKNNNDEGEIIDLETAAKNGTKPPKGKKYQYIVDDKKYISDTETMKGHEILEKAGKIPAKDFILRKKVKGNWVTIKLDEVVDFTEPGLEKFKTLPNDQTDGSDDESNESKPPRRGFDLLEEDEEFLNSLGLVWETIVENNQNWILIHGYSVVPGYNTTTASIAFRLDSGYPTAQIDMVYFDPPLSRADAQPINNLSNVVIDGRNHQQWSRHRTPANPWRDGIDNLSTHYPLVDAWLLKEFEKKPSHAASA